jgi:4-coumarate--CoA ligase
MSFLATEHVHLSTRDLLSWMVDEPHYDEEKAILIDAANPSRFICRLQARILIRRIAAGLRRAGLKPTGSVCIHAFNDIYYTIACLGIIAAGGIFAGTSPSYTAFEPEHLVRIANIRFWMVDPDLLFNVRSAAGKTEIPERNVLAFDLRGEIIPTGIRSWTTL